ncbi:MAG: penicillin-binding protein [Thermotoga sp. 4484_232]|nr:MAG: penicillin-binding protein [Thermotoga sp. 4484_232]
MKKFFFFIIPFALVSLTLHSLYIFITKDLPDPESKMPIAVKMFYNDGSPMYISKNLWIDLSEVPEMFLKTLLISEDEDFYKHFGIDISGLMRALIYDLVTFSFSQGGSTITQQLARSLYLSNEKSLIRKFKEMMIAFWLEKRRTKDEILEMYINSIYVGNGLYGFETAARYYFGRSLKELSLAEMAVLVGMIRSPENFNPKDNLEKAKEKALTVLKRLLNEGVIPQNRYEEALKDVENLKVSQNGNYHFNEELFWRIVGELREIGFSLNEVRKGYALYTTIDKDLQRIVESVSGERKDIAFFSMNPKTGEILCYHGIGVNEGNRQLGSAIKPFYYYLSFLMGYSPKDIIPDLPIKIGSWSPENFTKSFKGAITLEKALIWSENVPSVILFDILTLNSVKDFLKNSLKISGKYPDDLTLSLGTLETSPEEVVKAFSAVINGGVVLKPFVIKKIVDSNGNVVYEGKPHIVGSVATYKRGPIDATNILKTILLEVVNEGTGRLAKIPGKNIMGKTGTAEKNAWFVGGDDNFLMGVTIDGEDLLGGRACAPVWKEVVERWGKFEGKVSITSTSFNDGKVIFSERILNMLDFERIVKLIYEGDVSEDSLVFFLKKLPQKYQVEFLSKIYEIDPILSTEIWKKVIQ